MEIKREGQERENEGIIALPTNTSHALDGERRRLMGVKLNGSTSAKERGREQERRRAGEGRKCEHNRLNLPGRARIRVGQRHHSPTASPQMSSPESNVLPFF